MLKGGVEFSKSHIAKLSPEQKEVYLLWAKKGLKPKQIAQARQTHISAVYKTIAKLKQKYAKSPQEIKGVEKKGVYSHFSTPPKPHFWRYHALEWEIKPYYFTDKYKKILNGRGNTHILGDWRFMLYPKKVICWLLDGEPFQDQDKDRAVMQTLEDYNRTLEKAGQKYGFRVFKNGYIHSRLLKEHLAYTDASEYDFVTQDKAIVQFRQNGQVYLQYDKSKGPGEREYVRDPVTVSDQLEPYLNDLAFNAPLNNSQLGMRLNDTVTAIEKMQEVLALIVKRL